MLSGPQPCTESTTPTRTFFSYISVQEVPKIASYKWDTGAAETYKVLMTNSLLASLWSGPALMEGMQTTMGLVPFPRTWICLLSVGDKWKHHDLAFPRSLLLFFLYSSRTKVPSNAACTTCEVAQHSGFSLSSLPAVWFACRTSHGNQLLGYMYKFNHRYCFWAFQAGNLK